MRGGDSFYLLQPLIPGTPLFFLRPPQTMLFILRGLCSYIVPSPFCNPSLLFIGINISSSEGLITQELPLQWGISDPFLICKHICGQDGEGVFVFPLAEQHLVNWGNVERWGRRERSRHAENK